MEIKEKKLVEEYFKFIFGFLIIMILAGVGYFISQAYFNKENNPEIKENKISGRIIDVSGSSKNDFKPVLEIDLNKQNQAPKNIGGEEQETEENQQPGQQVRQIQPTATTTVITETKNSQPIIFKECSFNTSQSPSRQKVIINEIAWMGGSSDFGLTATDEWIELKNISGAEVDVGNWQLIDKAEQIKINLNALNDTKIKAGGFILLERTDNDSVPNIPADLIYSNTLNNSDEGLRLFDNQCNLIDEVFANPDWPAGDNDQKRTMERSSNLSWHTHNGAVQSGVFGTPKKENSAPAAVLFNNESASSGGASTNNQQQTTTATSTGSPAKILINEIQAYPTGNRFIELYNPNNFSVDLTNRYLQRKIQTGGSFDSLVSKTYFEGKVINANSYFLISRNALNGADIVLDNLTITESNVIQFKNSNGEIVDKVGWGQASDCEGNCALQPSENQSIQRKFQNNTFIDTDNNANDFEIQTCPSPKAQSKTCQQTNQAPGAFFVYAPQNPSVDELINFDAASSTDADGQIISYQWDFGDNATSSISTAATLHVYSQAGNYLASLIVFDNQNVSSTATSTTISVTSPVIQQSSQANHIVISEIMAGIDGNTNYEFIEFYNPTTNPIDLTGWAIKKRSSTGAESSFVVSSRFQGKIIPPKKYFLIANEGGYNGSISPDIVWPASYNLAYANNAIIFYNNNNEIVDEVIYQNIEAGKSLERKAWQNNSCVSAQNNGEFLGNACDTDSETDFEIRQAPNQQNSQSPPE